ncbi:LytTR family DNA-binding domain-containing protein [Zhihengliuella sp.]|uniref:LytR/AlgR family response regulator transcription factor n=1 Tax=Zhihengliuella sp. TaxID=1954483 RepID=UPI0028111C01|nr:LytTR family DNA-binding domain-containing protein [Zhihengliuella sp.]
MINVVVADDELPAVEELAYLLAQDPRVGAVHRALSGAQALRALQEHDVDALFLDIHMPALSGLDIARALARHERPPAVVFVTADEAQALEAFELAAVDYVLKPIRPERLAESVRRVCETVEGPTADSDLVTVDQGGVTRMIRRSDITYVQAHGDYARLHTAEGSYLIRIPLSDLEEQWSQSFVRIHRSYLVAMDHIERVKLQSGRAGVSVGGTELPVSRRSLPWLRERLRSHRVRPS